MMILRCSNCGTQERVSNLQGSWLVKCNSCGQTMMVIGSSPNPETAILTQRIECPGCGYREESVLPGRDVTVICPVCQRQWQVKVES